MSALFQAGFYPPDLYLLEKTSITLTELDEMDKERKFEYFLFLMEKERLLAQKKSSDGEPKNTYLSEDDI